MNNDSTLMNTTLNHLKSIEKDTKEDICPEKDETLNNNLNLTFNKETFNRKSLIVKRRSIGSRCNFKFEGTKTTNNTSGQRIIDHFKSKPERFKNFPFDADITNTIKDIMVHGKTGSLDLQKTVEFLEAKNDKVIFENSKKKNYEKTNKNSDKDYFTPLKNDDFEMTITGYHEKSYLEINNCNQNSNHYVLPKVRQSRSKSKDVVKIDDNKKIPEEITTDKLTKSRHEKGYYKLGFTRNELISTKLKSNIIGTGDLNSELKVGA